MIAEESSQVQVKTNDNSAKSINEPKTLSKVKARINQLWHTISLNYLNRCYFGKNFADAIFVVKLICQIKVQSYNGLIPSVTT